MFWKLLGLQKKLDALFDDGWVSLGLSSDRVNPLRAPATVVFEYPGE
jgi:hypothetical protein